jgi:hypothetical protein
MSICPKEMEVLGSGSQKRILPACLGQFLSLETWLAGSVSQDRKEWVRLAYQKALVCCRVEIRYIFGMKLLYFQ